MYEDSLLANTGYVAVVGTVFGVGITTAHIAAACFGAGLLLVVLARLVARLEQG